LHKWRYYYRYAGNRTWRAIQRKAKHAAKTTAGRGTGKKGFIIFSNNRNETSVNQLLPVLFDFQRKYQNNWEISFKKSNSLSNFKFKDKCEAKNFSIFSDLITGLYLH
jgi:hypothetical protein